MFFQSPRFRLSINAKGSESKTTSSRHSWNPFSRLSWNTVSIGWKYQVAISGIVLLCPVRRRVKGQAMGNDKEVALLDVTLQASKEAEPDALFHGYQELGAKETVAFKHGQKITVPVSPPIPIRVDRSYCIMVKEVRVACI